MTSTPLRFEDLRQPRALLRSPAGIVLDRQPDEQRLVVGPVRAHRFGDLGDEAHPVGFRAAIFVGALVGSLRQELVHEIAVRAMQLQHVEAGLMGAPRRVAPGLHQVLHLVALQRLRHRPFLAVGDRARRHRRPGVPVVDVGRPLQRPVAFPGPRRARLAAGMAELDARDRILLLDEFDEAAERLDEGVVPDAEIADRAAAAPLDLCRIRRRRGRRRRRRICRHSSDASRSESPSRPNIDASAAPRCGCAARRRGSSSAKTAAFPIIPRFLIAGHHCPGETPADAFCCYCLAAPSGFAPSSRRSWPSAWRAAPWRRLSGRVVAAHRAPGIRGSSVPGYCPATACRPAPPLSRPRYPIASCPCRGPRISGTGFCCAKAGPASNAHHSHDANQIFMRPLPELSGQALSTARAPA